MIDTLDRNDANPALLGAYLDLILRTYSRLKAPAAWRRACVVAWITTGQRNYPRIIHCLPLIPSLISLEELPQ